VTFSSLQKGVHVLRRQDFLAIADVFRQSRPFQTSTAHVDGCVDRATQWAQDVVKMADMLSRECPSKFNRERFYLSCGMEGGRR